jgi:probable F420-dependent oxidoreductase
VKIDTAIYGLTDAAERARQLEAAGVDGVFTFEGPHDVFVPLALAAASTELHTMTNVAIAFPRNPIHLAHAARDLQALSGGRFVLGLGTQIRPQIERRFGVDFDEPVARLREQIEAIRAILACWQDGTRLEFEGRFFRHTLMTPMFSPGPSPWGPPPIAVGALGPRMTEMVATTADGLLVMPFTSRRFFEAHTLTHLRRGLAAAGRDRTELSLVAELIVCTGRSDEEQAAADAGTRALLGFYGSTPSYRPVLDVEGYGDLQPELRQLTREARWDEMAGLIDDHLLATIAVRGTPAEVADQLVERYAPHADRLALYLPYGFPDDLLAEVVEALRARSPGPPPRAG